MRACSVVSCLVLVPVLGLGCGKSEKSKPPATGTGSASLPGDAAAAAADAAAVVDAASAVDAAAAIDAPAAAVPPPPDGFLIASAGAKPGEILVASLADIGTLAGTRWALFDERGRVCTATVGAAVACGDGAAGLTEVEGDCTKAMYGLPVDAKLATTRVRAAPAPVDKLAADDYGSDEQRMADSKAAVEGGEAETVTVHSSTRILERADHTSLVLAYGTIYNDRTIQVYALAGTPEAPELRSLERVPAPAPSRVVGVEIDGDRALDAVIVHAEGAALVTGAGTSVTLACKR